MQQRLSRSAVAPLFLLGLATAGPSSAQGRTDYFNVESPQVKPICVARVGGHDWLLLCNTPDNSVEIWDTDESLPASSRFVMRVRVGLEPVSVHFNPVTSCAYTADFLGDSVSVFALAADGQTLVARPSMTRHVGDEPMDLAFSADGLELFVTLGSSSAFGWRDAVTLDPLSPILSQADMGSIDLLAGGTEKKALKEPRAVLQHANRLYVLGFKGGHTGSTYDFDLYTRDLVTEAVVPVGRLGTTNFNMALASNGDLWVVGGVAENLTTLDEPSVAARPTGFVRSLIHRVRGAGTSGIQRVTRDLNDVDGLGSPVAFDLALAQPTDVVVYEPPGAESSTVFFTAFGSDRIGALTPTSSTDAYSWPLVRIHVPVAVPASQPTKMAGPRGLAVKYANPGDPRDPGDRLYVLNRLDSSFSIVDPAAGQPAATTIALHHDPTPEYIQGGRKFLYSAKLSGTGFVSCASCHMDGRTDNLLWRLGTPGDPTLPYPPGMADGIESPTDFAKDKGGMITQSLQGLLNFEVEPSAQRFFTNAPYHWRGDQSSLLGFNAAFVNLMKAPDPDQDGKGLTDVEMETFRTFVNSIQYPPNPNQPTSRVYSGAPITDATIADPTNLDNPGGGSGAQRGLLLYHVKALDQIADGRSCAQCHTLPEGSNNRGTVPTGIDPIETAALRGLFQKEGRLDKEAGAPSPILTGSTGLNHLGTSVSLNGFMSRFDADFTDWPGVPNAGLLELKQLVRELDWGVAPLVGRSHTVDSTSNAVGDPGWSTTQSTLDLFEQQAALANVGVAVAARLGGQDSGFWLDLTQSPATYRLEGGTAQWTRSALLGLVTGSHDRLVFLATPLGSERRVASVGGTSAPLIGPAPTELLLRPCPTSTANAVIPTMLGNWDPLASGGTAPFAWLGSVPTPPFLKSLRLLQYGLVNDAAGQFGLTQLRHEAPRRFAVAGHGIQPGARLRLSVPHSTTPPDPQGPVDGFPVLEFLLPIHPTAEVLADGRRVWQTAVEVEPLVLYQLLMGGPLAQGVGLVVSAVDVATLPEPPPSGHFAPLASNWHHVRVRNPDGAEGSGGWQRLTLQ